MSSILSGAAHERKPKKPLEQVRDVMRFKHYSLRTERTYSDWIARFIRFDSFVSHSLSLPAFPSMS
jgi:Phage integrase, N-terminal SAM-like domain